MMASTAASFRRHSSKQDGIKMRVGVVVTKRNDSRHAETVGILAAFACSVNFARFRSITIAKTIRFEGPHFREEFLAVLVRSVSSVDSTIKRNAKVLCKY
jgi:hypothetical protein